MGNHGRSLVCQGLAHGISYVLGADAEDVEQLLRLSAARDTVNSQPGHNNARLRSNCWQHSFPETTWAKTSHRWRRLALVITIFVRSFNHTGQPTFLVVVLHSDDTSSCGFGTSHNGFCIQGLDGEGINHANIFPCRNSWWNEHEHANKAPQCRLLTTRGQCWFYLHQPALQQQPEPHAGSRQLQSQSHDHCHSDAPPGQVQTF